MPKRAALSWPKYRIKSAPPLTAAFNASVTSGEVWYVRSKSYPSAAHGLATT
ncbi:MAG: hypothetical protein WCT04_17785 [Planctomycetota bacterium]